MGCCSSNQAVKGQNPKSSKAPQPSSKQSGGNAKKVAKDNKDNKKEGELRTGNEGGTSEMDKLLK